MIFKIGLAAIVLFLLTLFTSLIYFDLMYGAQIPAVVVDILVILLFATIISALILWVRGWIYISNTWSKRSIEMNILFVIVMIVAWWIAAFYFHYLANSISNRNPASHLP
jgi:hypothetical protein